MQTLEGKHIALVAALVLAVRNLVDELHARSPLLLPSLFLTFLSTSGDDVFDDAVEHANREGDDQKAFPAPKRLKSVE